MQNNERTLLRNKFYNEKLLKFHVLINIYSSKNMQNCNYRATQEMGWLLCINDVTLNDVTAE